MADPEFILLGDALWLDFVNTARGRGFEPTERLTNSADYHRWTKAEKLVPDADATGFREVLALRERLTALALALAAGRQVPAAAVDALNAMLAEQVGHAQLVRRSGRWALHVVPDRPLTALEAVAWSAASTLGDALARIHECAGDSCSLLLMDRTPDHSRQFCSPASCGSRGQVERRRRAR